MGMTFETWLETERARYGNVRFSVAERARLGRAWDAAIISVHDSKLTTCIGAGGGASEANAKHIEETLGPGLGPHGQKNVAYSSQVEQGAELASAANAESLVLRRPTFYIQAGSGSGFEESRYNNTHFECED